MVFKNIYKILLLAFITFSLSAMSSAAQLKIATVAPEGSAWMNAMRAGAGKIKERTEGRVKVKFYGGGVMGNEASVTRKIRIGQLHGGAFTSGGLARIYNDAGIYSVPFLFQNTQEAAYVRQYIDPILMQGMEEKGFVILGMAQGGFGKLMSANSMQSLDDLKGKKLWVPDDDELSFEMMRDLGLSPVKLPLTDVLTGLQTQLLEIVGSSATGAIALQWHTKIKYVLDQPLVYLYGTLVVDKRMFGKLSDPDQEIVRDVFKEIYLNIDAESHLENQQAEQALRDLGVTFQSGDNAEVRNIITQIKALTVKMVDRGDISKDLYDQIQGHIKDFNAQNQSASSSTN